MESSHPNFESVRSKSGRGKSIPCDLCNEEAAVLYCRVDAAKLFLFYDQHIHAANALSRKHLESQICDNCGSDPVAVCCSIENLVLCQDCDWDAHTSCAVFVVHAQSPVKAFSGFPLTAIWAWKLREKNTSRFEFELDRVVGPMDVQRNLALNSPTKLDGP